jgi:hypothetical protein
MLFVISNKSASLYETVHSHLLLVPSYCSDSIRDEHQRSSTYSHLGFVLATWELFAAFPW